MSRSVVKAAGVVTFLFVMLIACVPRFSKDSLVGSYRLKKNGGEIILQLLQDETFMEIIMYADGSRVVHRGKWNPPSKTSSKIAIDGLWIPREFAPEYINEAEDNGEKKYSAPDYWVTSPYVDWGAISIAIYPDDNMYFRKVSP